MSEERSVWSYTRPSGLQDAHGSYARTLRTIEDRVLDMAQRYGYEYIQVPTIEYLDLYHPERVGVDLFHGLMVARLSEGADFPARRSSASQDVGKKGALTAELIHDVALRPEFTAPLARTLVTRMLDEGRPLHWPLRVAYAGTVFRDIRPKPPLRLREFHQVGVELVGCVDSRADLEILLLACDTADALGLPNWELRLGHAKLYRAILKAMGVADADLGMVARGLELAARLSVQMATPDESWVRYARGFASDLRERLKEAALHFEEGALQEPATATAENLRVTLRPALHRLLKHQWKDRIDVTQIDTVLGLETGRDAEATLQSLTMHAHTIPDATLRADVEGPLQELRTLYQSLRDLRPQPIIITPAASRGIAYYTGMTFEIHCDATQGPYTDVCGGGRYDNLHRWVHDRARSTREVRGHRIPTDQSLADLLNGVGFAFGTERVAAAVGLLPNPTLRPVYLAVIERECLNEAFRTADTLRARGIPAIAELIGPGSKEELGIGLREQIGHASRREATFLLIFGGEAREAGEVEIRDMTLREQNRLPLSDALQRIEAAYISHTVSKRISR